MKSTIYISLFMVVFLLLSTTGFGQRKFALSATVAPSYTRGSTALNLSRGDDLFRSSSTVILNSDVAVTGYWAGLNGTYSFTPKWSASAGLWFSHSLSKAGNVRVRSHEFSIPVLINYRVLKHKISPYISAGLSYNFDAATRISISDYSIVETKSPITATVSPTLAAGVIFDLSPQISLIAQPTAIFFSAPENLTVSDYLLGFQAQFMFRL
ncbi:hypothetical protein DSL64_01780 [Dyadobacter luteus]|uniref:Uncharacterized protein n=1 Tax=Dyadobacter luteus TaxID=2259619 RepID=A0A3D8YHK1_9BACT|nr:outer membrane beta-barrel protein [Dyadobacter luteus]REA64303.1 hypothetical protein DSL64_01780 [Dyadobacter luteus]